jgi:DNA polymerase-3 subunit epsilon
MELFAPVYGEWDEYHGNWKWQKLSTAAAYYGYEWGDECAHDALADCRATLYVWKKLKEALQDENG